MVQEILQDGFGINPDEFFAQDAIQQFHVAGVDAIVVVHHREVTDVQNVSNDDPAIFAASGLTPKKTGKPAPQPVAVPSFRSLDFGANSGQIVVTVKAVAGGKSYFIRYAVMNGTTPGPWTTIPAAEYKEALFKAVTQKQAADIQRRHSRP